MKTNGSPFLHRKDWKLRRCNSFEDMRVEAIRSWQRAGANARANAAWDMVVEAWHLQNRDPDELRLQRTVTVLHKA